MEFPLAAGEILEGDDFIFSSGDEWGMLRLIFALPGYCWKIEKKIEIKFCAKKIVKPCNEDF